MEKYILLATEKVEQYLKYAVYIMAAIKILEFANKTIREIANVQEAKEVENVE